MVHPPLALRLAFVSEPPASSPNHQHRTMTTTCLINNYNYGRYVIEAVESALRQTTPFDEIVVVDDGSTDGSVDLLRENFADQPTVEIVAKSNAGQLSCFNEGFRRATGDLVCFLDADDGYEARYLETVLAQFGQHPQTDFLYCGRRYFGDRQGEWLPYAADRDLGYSTIRTVHQHAWIGGPTSCLSIRRPLLARMLPLPLEADWRTRADDCLVFGASLAGGRKRYLAQPLVRYRVHPTNHFCGKRPDAVSTYRRRLAVNRLFGHLVLQMRYDVPQLADFAHREFRTLAEPDFDDFTSYLRLTLRARLAVARKLSCAASIGQHYFGSRWARERRRPTDGERTTTGGEFPDASLSPLAATDRQQSAA